MRISEQWLREWVNPDIETDDLAHLMTMAGLEVAGVEPVSGEFAGVVVAEIVAAARHPDADRLRVCEVSTGSETLQIVCGAPNARAGLKAPLATIGGILPGKSKIKKARLHGVESQGMLCAGAELGLSDDDDGLLELAADAPVGADLCDYLGLNDTVIDVDLTPNRSDCLGLRGVAREVGLLTQTEVSEPRFDRVTESISDTFAVTLQNPESCSRFVGRVIKGIDMTRATPLWIRERLRRSGLRSIDAVVDITNYVLLELGQPMHAFDFNQLRGRIVVRQATAGEQIDLLDGQSVQLKEDTLLIADDSGPVAMAGIMGGAASAVSEATTDIMFEAAFFHPAAIAGRARSYGLQTDASHRFERGVDYRLQRYAMERATQLALDIVGGEAAPITEVVSEQHIPSFQPVRLRRERIRRMLGFDMADPEVERILTGLGLAVSHTDEGWQVQVPSWRFDLSIEADLLEELARIYGYNNLPVGQIHSDLIIRRKQERRLSIREIRRRLVAHDYQEAITYSFVDPVGQALFDSAMVPVPVSNPISSELSVMRTSLLPGLMESLVRNVNRQQSRVRLFETGLRFLPAGRALDQRPTLAAVATGRRLPESWSERGETVDFYDVKGDFEALLSLTASESEFRFSAGEREGLHPGRTAAISRCDQIVGYIGALHPQSLAHYGLSNPVYCFEVDLVAIRGAALPDFKVLSKFPETRRDLAVIVDREVPAAELLENVRTIAGTYLTDLRLFDVYEGKGIDPKRKSLALGLTFRDSSLTLSGEEISKSVDQVIDLLKKTYNAKLRN